jgi:hypothetical protein
MRRLILVLLVGGVGAIVGGSPASAVTHKNRACSAVDKAGNWEVVIGHGATSKAAGSIRTRAAAKGLHARVERDGCAKRWEVVITASTKAKANSEMKLAQKDGFSAVTIEKS